MSATDWWSSWTSKKSWRASEQRRRQSRRAPAAIECLEDRRLLSGIQFSQSVYRIAEGTRTLDVTLTREDWTSGSDSVLIVETGGTATGGGSDYWNGAFPVNAIFQPGEREATVTLVLMSPRGDQFLEGVETIELGLVDNDHYNVTFGEQKTATIEIHDAFLSIESEFEHVLEDRGPHTFDVVLNMADGLALSEDAVFEVAIDNGVAWPTVVFRDGIRRGAVSLDDYVLDTHQIRFAAGSRNGATQTITITPISDSLEEGIEGFFFRLTQISGAPFYDHVRNSGSRIIDVPPERINNPPPFTPYIPISGPSRFDNDSDVIIEVPADDSVDEQPVQLDLAAEHEAAALPPASSSANASFPVLASVSPSGSAPSAPLSAMSGRMDLLAEFLNSGAPTILPDDDEPISHTQAKLESGSTGLEGSLEPGLVHSAFTNAELLADLLLLVPSI